jgi:hypothetical protein
MNKVEEEPQNRDDKVLQYLNSVALAAMPEVIKVLGRENPSEFMANGMNIGRTCYDIAWSMLRARRAERKAWEEEWAEVEAVAED